MPGKQDGPLGEGHEVVIAADQERRTEPHAGGGDRTAFEKQGIVRHQGSSSPRIGVVTVAEHQGPGLEDDDPAMSIEGPFGVLRVAVVPFQRQRVFGKGLDLFLGETRPVAIFFGDGNFQQPTLRAAHQLDGLGGNLRFENGQRIGLGDGVSVRGDDAVYRVRSKSPNRVDDDVFFEEIERMMGIDHATGDRVDHLQAGHAHGGTFVGDALAQPIGDGARRKQAGQDELVGPRELVAGDVEHG